MKQKKFTIILLSIVLSTYFIIGCIIYIIDPSWTHKNTQNNIKTKSSKFTIPRYIEDLSTNKFIIVFGTSRGLRFSSDVLNTNIKVMKPHHAYGNPHCVLNFLNQLTKQEVNNIEKIYYNLSNIAFNKLKLCELTDYKSLSKFDMFFSEINFASIGEMYNNIRQIDLTYKVNEYGSITDIEIRNWKPVIENRPFYIKEINKDMIKSQIITNDTFDALHSVDKFSKMNNIDTVYFTDALSDYWLFRSNYELTKTFHIKLLNAIDGYYGLNYIENFSDNYSYFNDGNHINTNGAKYISRNIFTGKKNNYYIDKNNINEYLDYLKYGFEKSKSKFME